MFLTEKSCERARVYLNQEISLLRGKDSSFRVHYWGVSPYHFNNPVHKHSFFEVCYVIDGTGSYTDEGIEYPLTSGDIFCSRPGIRHQIRSETGLYLLFIAFEAIESDCTLEICQQFNLLKHQKNVVVRNAHQTPSGLTWRALTSGAAQNDVSHENLLYLSHALVLLFTQLFEARKERKTKPLSESSASLLYQAKLFIHDNISQPLQLNDVASYLYISDRHLSRLFSIELGETFTAYVRRERIQQAAKMLTTTSLPIKNIAEKTGFNSVHYFTRVFAQEMNAPPALYRQSNAV